MRKGRRSRSFHTVAGTCASGQAQPDEPPDPALAGTALVAALAAIVVGFLVYRRMTRGDAMSDRGIAGFAGETTVA